MSDEPAPRLAQVTYLPGARPAADLPTLQSVFGRAEENRDAAARDDAVGADEADDVELGGESLGGEVLEDESSSQLDEAVTLSTRALARKDLSRRELERLLRSHHLADDVIESRVAHLESVGLIDDMALAQHLVGTLQERKGLGRSAIAAELARRMFAPAAIGYALELVDSGDELARARDLAHNRARQLMSLDRDVAIRRLSAFLARRGYSGSAVRAAVESALPARGSLGSPVRFR